MSFPNRVCVSGGGGGGVGIGPIKFVNFHSVFIPKTESILIRV